MRSLAVARSARAGSLEALLVAASFGDVDAFMRFYDATHGYAFGLALTRARASGLAEADARAAAESATSSRFVRAWQHAAAHQASGLSPLAWLLTLPDPGPGGTGRTPEVACA
ncbi:hypothetical protein [Marmoricola sp. RAF53]|uniref:hypothetical protein n=1 Tax=Marmoricola sp. RAF53 TaxID=3233059 RepID=UPI003F9D7C20